MHIWEVTNSEGETIRIKADCICDLPCEFTNTDGDMYPVVTATRID